MGGCMSSAGQPTEPPQSASPDPRPDAYMLAEQYFEQHRSLRAQEQDSLNRVLLNSRVEHDNSAGSTAVEPSVPASESGRSASEMERRSVAASQASALERHQQRSASLGRSSETSARTPHRRESVPQRSDSLRSAESEARRERRRQERVRKEEEELAMALAVSASEAEAVQAALEEPIALDDARAIAAAQAELDQATQDGAGAQRQQQQQPSRKQHGHHQRGRCPQPAAVRPSRSSNSACETIREAAEEEATAPSGDEQEPRTSFTLRDRYTTTVAVPTEYTEAELAAYDRIQAAVHSNDDSGGGSGGGSNGGSSNGGVPKHQHRSGNGGTVLRSDDTAYSGSVSGSSGRRGQTLDYIAECEAKLAKLSPHSGRRRSLEQQIKHQQQMKQREQDLEDQLRSPQAWCQTSLDSAYDGAKALAAQMHAARGFMCV